MNRDLQTSWIGDLARARDEGKYPTLVFYTPGTYGSNNVTQGLGVRDVHPVVLRPV